MLSSVYSFSFVVTKNLSCSPQICPDSAHLSHVATKLVPLINVNSLCLPVFAKSFKCVYLKDPLDICIHIFFQYFELYLEEMREVLSLVELRGYFALPFVGSILTVVCYH